VKISACGAARTGCSSRARRWSSGWAAATGFRPAGDLEGLLRRAYNDKAGIEEVGPGLERAASALNAKRMWLAQSEAGHLPLPDLANPIAAPRLEIEDLRIAAEPLRQALIRAGWDEGKHPRAGIPPNPGWFAPVNSSAELLPVAGSEEEERPEDALDPLAEARQRIWQSGPATLRQIDPANPQLQSLHGPDWLPSEADLDTLHATIRDVELRRVLATLMPNGAPIGTPGSSRYVREMPGGNAAARELFRHLQVGGGIDPKADLDGVLVR
jgi:hypothetical protein